MPRPKLIRKISKLPHFKGFRPIGIEENGHVVVLNYEEYEAIKLSDYQMLGQFCASEIMGVSRPTYTRIYEVARRKIAKAFTEGLPIVFEGGKVYFDSEWFSCSSCGCMFNHHKEGFPERCSLCGSADVKQFPWDSTEPEAESEDENWPAHNRICQPHHRRKNKYRDI